MSEVKRYTKALNHINNNMIPNVDCKECALNDGSPCGFKSYDLGGCLADHEALTIASEAICRLLSLLK